MSEKRILITDDHYAIVKGLEAIISSHFENVNFGEAFNYSECVKMLQSQQWDIVILNSRMPGRNGFEVLALIKQNKMNVRVLMFSAEPETVAGVRALRAGAWGYIDKHTNGEEIITAIYTILSGKKYISSSLAELLANELFIPEGKMPHEILSEREREVFILIAQGKTPTEIATELSLALPTISTYRGRIFKKMSLKNNSEIINYAIKNKLTT